MENNQGLVKQVSGQLRASYRAAIGRGSSLDELYDEFYPQVVQIVAKEFKVNEAKTRFESRLLIQQVIRDLAGISS